jgi:hypothetical protein
MCRKTWSDKQCNPSNGKHKSQQQVNSSKTNVLLTAVGSNQSLTQALNLYDLFLIAQIVKLIIIIIIDVAISGERNVIKKKLRRF